MSKRYISDRFLPDKAIDLIDEAASLLKIKSGKSPSKTLKSLEKELKKIIAKKEEAVLSAKYILAAEYKQKEELLEAKIRNLKKATKSYHEPEITAENIAEVISITTGVPITRLIKKESESLLNMEKNLKKRIIGQDEAIKEVARAIRRSRTGISNEKRPIGTFIFLGPTGVGKTELAKVLAGEMFNSEDMLIKIDMSEFMEKHNIARLVGAPAGYVGYDEGGQLTEMVRRKPYSVILLDEIEKAHPDVFNMFLQILEDGYLTDAKGLRVDFRNTIIIMTSNVGAERMFRTAKLGFSAETAGEEKELDALHKKISEEVMETVKKKFRPEFINRVDKIVVFKALSRLDVKKIVNLQLKDLQKRLKEKNITIKVSESAKRLLIEKGYDVENGARPMRRTIENLIESPLAEGMLSGEFKEGDLISIMKMEDKLQFYVLQVESEKKKINSK
jgi:ATP-dependent Clp protease ATP-binding subunit ClpC